jgi:hypothetical protein
VEWQTEHCDRHELVAIVGEQDEGKGHHAGRDGRALEVAHLASAVGQTLGGDVVARQTAQAAEHEKHQHALIDDGIETDGVGDCRWCDAEGDQVGE